MAIKLYMGGVAHVLDACRSSCDYRDTLKMLDALMCLIGELRIVHRGNGVKLMVHGELASIVDYLAGH